MTTPEINRGSSNFVEIEIVGAPGDSFALKRPKFAITPEAEQGFAFLHDCLPEHPLLQQRFPQTEIVHNESGAYYAQRLVLTNPGQENMASLSDPASFDMNQIQNREDLATILALMEEGLDFFRNSLHDPTSGLERGVGWFLETHLPDSYVRGRLQGRGPDTIYFVDCHPIIPVTEQELEPTVHRFYDAIDKIAHDKFSIKLEDLLPNGNG